MASPGRGACLLAALSIMLGFLLGMSGAATLPAFVDGQLLVRFNPKAGVSAASVSSIQGLQVLRTLGGPSIDGQGGGAASVGAASAGGSSAVPTSNVVVFSITDGSSVPEKVKELSSSPAILHVEPNYITEVKSNPFNVLPGNAARPSRRRALQQAGGSREPTDPRYPQNGIDYGQWWLRKVGAPQAWATTTGSKQIRVCDIDTGIRASHEDLKGNLIGGWNKWNPLAKINDPTPSGSSPEEGLVNDDFGYGTPRSGLMGAVGNNGIGVAGMSWNVGLLSCKALGVDTAIGAVYYTNAAVLDCMYVCNQAGAKVITTTYALTKYSQILADAVNKLRTDGVLLVAGAVSEAPTTQLRFPAGLDLDNVIAVASSNSRDEYFPPVDAYGPWVHLTAPGMVLGTTSFRNDSAYTVVGSGAIYSSAIVAGAAGLLWSARPNATYSAIRQALLDSVTKSDALTGVVATGGSLNVARAMARLTGQPDPATPMPPTYDFVELSNTDLQPGYFRSGVLVVTNASSSAACMNSCKDTSWCFIAQSYPDNSIFANEIGEVGNCVLLGQDAGFYGPPTTLAGALAGYKVAVFPAPPPSPSPSPPVPPPPPVVPSPPPIDPLANPVVIPSLPFNALITQNDMIMAAPPEECLETYFASRVDFAPLPDIASLRVYRWFANTPKNGTLTASTCSSKTEGDPAIFILSSPSPSADFTCELYQDDDFQNKRCLLNFADIDLYTAAFVATTNFTVGRFYYFVVLPSSNRDFDSSKVQQYDLTITATLDGAPSSPPPPPAPGTWAKPLVVPRGNFISKPLETFPAVNSTAIAFQQSPFPAVACPMARNLSLVYRWFSGASAGSITSTSCLQGSFGDSVISVLSSPNPVGGPYTCVGGNDVDGTCPFTQQAYYNATSPFTFKLNYKPATHYFFAVAPYSPAGNTRFQLKLSDAPLPSPPPPPRPSPPPPAPRFTLFLGKAATQSTVPPKAGAGLAIDGKKGTATFTLSQANPWLQIDLGAVVDVSKVTIVGKAAGAQLAPNVKAPAYTAKHTFTVRIGNKKLKAGTAVDKSAAVCATLKGALKTAPGSTLPCGAQVGGKFVPSTRRGRYITIDLSPPRTPKNKPGSERLVVAEVTAIAKALK